MPYVPRIGILKHLPNKTYKNLKRRIKRGRKTIASQALVPKLSQKAVTIQTMLNRNVKLKYSLTFKPQSFTPTGQGYFGNECVFLLNAPNQPCLTMPYTATLHQPQGYDQISAIMLRYNVYAIKIHIESTSPDIDGLMLAYMIEPSNAGKTLYGLRIDDVVERPNVGWRWMTSNGNSKTVHLHSFRTIAGIDKVDALKVREDDQYSAHYDANPALCPSLHLAVCNSQSDTQYGATVNVQLTYYCRVMEPKMMYQS